MHVEDHSADFDLVQRCLLGDQRALVALRDKCHLSSMIFLVHSGALEIEARDIMDAIWGGCAAAVSGIRPARLERFHGRSSILTWLKMAALNDLIDHRRRELQMKRIVGLVEASGYNAEEFPSCVPAGSWSPSAEAPLLKIMRDALHQAMEACPASGLVMLQLVYLKGISQREVGRMWGYPKSKVQRKLKSIMRRIALRTLAGTRAVDPWLEIRWEDFLELCACADFSPFG